jgi:FMN-dependent NADH-azoreductase
VRDVAAGQAALNEFLVADILVVGMPMYNFSIPPQLKAWIDRLAIPGKTFRYTKNGPEGLAGGKKIIAASSCGGFSGRATPLALLDHQETYLRDVFGFFGITDVTFIRAEGVNVGRDHGAQCWGCDWPAHCMSRAALKRGSPKLHPDDVTRGRTGGSPDHPFANR